MFRQNAAAAKRMVTIQYLDQHKMYEVKNMDGKLITAQTGKELSENGFEVALEKLYDGELFEIGLQN